MPIEVHAVGVTCNLSCPYCYEHPMRDAGNFDNDADFDKITNGVSGYGDGQYVVMFGGEPLLMKIDEFEKYLKYGYERDGHVGIQTNGTLITDAHIELFKKYCVGVGISMDGPGELNDSRWAGSIEKTREATRKTEEAIDKLCKIGRAPGLIITLHRGNATTEKLPILKRWLIELNKKGITNARLHLLELDNNVESSMALSPEESAEAMLTLSMLSSTTSLQIDTFTDAINLLKGDDRTATCIYKNCDPWSTDAVKGVDSQGERVNCGRGTKEGINFIKSNKHGYERQIALYHAPQETGGCNGCRFFLMCKGECPGTGLEGDWRNRTSNCETWKILLSHYEKMMERFGLIPLSKSPDRVVVEYILMRCFERGMTVGLHTILEYIKNRDVSNLQLLADEFCGIYTIDNESGSTHLDSNVSKSSRNLPVYHAPSSNNKKPNIDVTKLQPGQHHSDNGWEHIDTNINNTPSNSKRPSVDVTKLRPGQYHIDNGWEHIDAPHQDSN